MEDFDCGFEPWETTKDLGVTDPRGLADTRFARSQLRFTRTHELFKQFSWTLAGTTLARCSCIKDAVKSGFVPVAPHLHPAPVYSCSFTHAAEPEITMQRKWHASPGKILLENYVHRSTCFLVLFRFSAQFHLASSHAPCTLSLQSGSSSASLGRSYGYGGSVSPVLFPLLKPQTTAVFNASFVFVCVRYTLLTSVFSVILKNRMSRNQVVHDAC